MVLMSASVRCKLLLEKCRLSELVLQRRLAEAQAHLQLFALSSTAALTVIAAALPREWRRAAVDEDGAIKTAPFDDSITFLVESIGGLRSLTPRQWKYSPRVADCDLLSVLFLCAGAG